MIDVRNFSIFREASDDDPPYHAWTTGCRTKRYLENERRYRRPVFDVGVLVRWRARSDDHRMPNFNFGLTVFFEITVYVLYSVVFVVTLFVTVVVVVLVTFRLEKIQSRAHHCGWGHTGKMPVLEYTTVWRQIT